MRLTRRAAIFSAAGAVFLFGAIETPFSTEGLKAGESGKVIRVLDGDSITLELEDGREISVRLAAVQAPRMALRGEKAWPYADEAKASLTALLQNRSVQLFYSGETRDRYGRAIAQVYTLDKTGQTDLWVQEEIIRLGFARVYSWAGELADLDALYVLEREARERSRGIWSYDDYAVRRPDPDPLAQYVDSVQIVEGVVISTADVRGQIYLNFGSDYKTDFTIAIAKKYAKRFTAIDPVSLTGARLRVRGWIEMKNGPMIWLDHPGRLEILS